MISGMQKRISQIALEWLPDFISIPANRANEDVLAAYLLAFHCAWNSHNGVHPTLRVEAMADDIWQHIGQEYPEFTKVLRFADRRELTNAILGHKRMHAPDDYRIIVRAGILPGNQGELRVVADFVNKADYDPNMSVSLDRE